MNPGIQILFSLSLPFSFATLCVGLILSCFKMPFCCASGKGPHDHRQLRACIIPAQPPQRKERFSLSTSLYKILREDSDSFCFTHLSSLHTHPHPQPTILGVRRKGNKQDKGLDQNPIPVVRGVGHCGWQFL